MSRAAHVEALRVEVENLSRRAESPTRDRRLSEAKAELDKFSDQPAEPRIETAAPDGPISSSRKRTRQS